MKLEPGAQVTANVHLVRPLGMGGMGSVWVAEHKALRTEVAVKFLGDEFIDNESIRNRFSREAAAASQVKSAHVVKVYDYGITDSKVPFIVMELLDGADLYASMREGKLDAQLTTNIVTQLCKALQSAHDQSVIHRDIKPENVFLSTESGELFVKLLDFGVAKSGKVPTTSSFKRSTMAGESVGTPYYMSPEQYRSSKEIDHRSDLWSVGVLVYEMMTGVVPFDAENLTSLAIVVNDGKARPPSEVEPSLPKAFDAWFAKACAREPKDRFDSARELAEALRVALAIDPAPRAERGGFSSTRVVVTNDADGDLSLRETAFANTSSRTTLVKARWPIGIAIVVIGAGIVGGVFLFRHSATADHAPGPDSAPPTTTAPPSNTIATTTATTEPALTQTTTSTAAAVETHTTVTPSIAKSIVKPVAPKASASAKGSHEEIW